MMLKYPNFWTDWKKDKEIPKLPKVHNLISFPLSEARKYIKSIFGITNKHGLLMQKYIFKQPSSVKCPIWDLSSGLSLNCPENGYKAFI